MTHAARSIFHARRACRFRFRAPGCGFCSRGISRCIVSASLSRSPFFSVCVCVCVFSRLVSSRPRIVRFARTHSACKSETRKITRITLPLRIFSVRRIFVRAGEKEKRKAEINRRRYGNKSNLLSTIGSRGVPIVITELSRRINCYLIRVCNYTLEIRSAAN